jgi:hypothetical protein
MNRRADDRLVKHGTVIQGRVLMAGRPVTPDMTSAQRKTQEALNAGYRPTPITKLL